MTSQEANRSSVWAVLMVFKDKKNGYDRCEPNLQLTNALSAGAHFYVWTFFTGKKYFF